MSGLPGLQDVAGERVAYNEFGADKSGELSEDTDKIDPRFPNRDIMLGEPDPGIDRQSQATFGVFGMSP